MQQVAVSCEDLLVEAGFTDPPGYLTQLSENRPFRVLSGKLILVHAWRFFVHESRNTLIVSGVAGSNLPFSAAIDSSSFSSWRLRGRSTAPVRETQMRTILRSLILSPLALAMIGSPSPSRAQIGIGLSITLAPPELPVYIQPAIPEPGYIWTPGYWAYGPDGYFWVPGTWVRPPIIGVLWTPGYWGWRDGVYVWNDGYWGRHIGYYGGINYGFGYVGVGYEGGYWNGGVFSYNNTVNNFGGVTIVNTYSKTVIINNTVNNVSFNGPGGLAAKPTPQEQVALQEQHTAPTPLQAQHVQAASTNHALLASVNHGAPAIAATSQPAKLSGPGVVATVPKGTTVPGYNAPANNAAKTDIKGPGSDIKGTTNGPANNAVKTDIKGPGSDIKGTANGPANSSAKTDIKGPGSDIKGTANGPVNNAAKTDIKGPGSDTKGTPNGPAANSVRTDIKGPGNNAPVGAGPGGGSPPPAGPPPHPPVAKLAGPPAPPPPGSPKPTGQPPGKKLPENPQKP
jgi:hypothetical protein